MRFETTSRLRILVILLSVFLSGLAPSVGQPGHGPGQGQPSGSPGYRGHELDHNLVLPQVAVGSNVTTTVVLLNMADLQRMPWATQDDLNVSGTIFFFDSAGNPLPVTPPQGAPTSEVRFNVGPSQITYLDFSAPGSARPGWALVEIDDVQSDESSWGMMDGQEPRRGERLMATALYTIRGDGGIQSQVGVVPATYQRGLHLNTVLAAQVGEKLNTGVAVANIGSDEARVEFRLRDTTGVMVESRVIDIASGNQIARFVSELFPDLPQTFQGSLEVISDQEGVVTLGLLSSEGILTTIPTRHFGSWSRGGMPL